MTARLAFVRQGLPHRPIKAYDGATAALTISRLRIPDRDILDKRMALFAIKRQNAFDVVSSLKIRRNAPIPIDSTLARVVSRQDEWHMTSKVCKQPSQVSKTSPDILFRVERVSYIESFRRIGNKLH